MKAIAAVAKLFSVNPAVRRHGRYQILSFFAVAMGLRVYNHGGPWHLESSTSAAWALFPMDAGRLSDRHFNLFQFARATAHLPGETAECGVFHGAGSHMILSAIKHTKKIHHIFDSFEGLSDPGKQDRTKDNVAFAWKAKDLHVAEEDVRKALSQFNNVRYHKGWIPSRFSDVAGETFSLVHIDVDLHQPTYDSLAFFYPRMTGGGIIVLDDYGFDTCPGVRAAVDEYMRGRPDAVIALTSGQGLVVKRA